MYQISNISNAFKDDKISNLILSEFILRSPIQ